MIFFESEECILMRKARLGRFTGTMLTALLCVSGMLASCGENGTNDTPAETKAPAETTAAEQDSAADTTTADEGNAEGQVFTDCITGTEDGYDYELWKDSGDTEMTLTGDGTFTCKWGNINNALFRRGKKFDCTQTYRDLGNISVDYGVDYQPDGNSYMCVYGWTRDPLIEYYIVETWGSWRPPGASSPLGTVTIDGGTYDIYRTTRYNQPSIDGDTTFDQYWSVRQDKPKADGTKVEGTISISKHFDAWEQVGLKLGNMYEVALNIEGYQSQGQATIYKNDLKIDGSYSADPAPEVEVFEMADPNGGANAGEPTASGFFTSDFDSDVSGWIPRGSNNVKQTTDEAKDGGSLFVSGRTDNWNGAAIMLDDTVFKAGETYSFKADVMQKSGETAQMKLTLQYDLDGTECYDEVALADAASGEWITLENPEYTIPEGATKLMLYVESPDSLTDFYVDNASGADKAS